MVFCPFLKIWKAGCKTANYKFSLTKLSNIQRQKHNVGHLKKKLSNEGME